MPPAEGSTAVVTAAPRYVNLSGGRSMADDFDPYRGALVIETVTVWPEEYDDWEPVQREWIEQRLHAEPDKAGHLEYVRTHTGFRRQITVTPADLERVGR